MYTTPRSSKTDAETRAGQEDSQGWTVSFAGLLVFLGFYYLNFETILPFLSGIPIIKIVGGSALLAVIVQNRLAGKPWLTLTREFYLLLTFVGIIVLGIPFSIWPGGAVEAFQERMAKIVILVLLMVNTINCLQKVRIIIVMMVLCGTIIALTGINNYLVGNVDRYGRLVGYGTKEFSNPNDFALGLVIIIPLACTLFLQEKTLSGKVLYLGSIIVMAISIVATLSRGGQLSLMFLAGVWIYSVGKFSPVKAMAALAAVVLLGTIAFATIPALSVRFESSFDSSKDETGSREARLEGMWDGFEIMLENPLLGVGIGQSLIAVAQRHSGLAQHWINIHDIYLQIGADLGIPALIVFIYLIVSIYRRLLDASRDDAKRPIPHGVQAYCSGLRVALLVFCVAAIFHPVAYNWFVYILIGLSAALIRLSRSPRNFEALLGRPFPPRAKESLGLP